MQNTTPTLCSNVLYQPLLSLFSNRYGLKIFSSDIQSLLFQTIKTTIQIGLKDSEA